MHVEDPNGTISYDDAYNTFVGKLEKDADEIGNEIQNLDGNYKFADFGVAARTQIENHLMRGVGYEPKLVPSTTCGSLLGGNCGVLAGSCSVLKNSTYLTNNGQVLVSPVSEFPYSWVQ